MTWPEQDPYSSPPYSSAPYQSNPQSGPPAGQYQQQYPPAQQQYPPAQPYQQGYPPYGYPQPASAATNTMAIVSLVLAFVFWPAAIVCGHIARKQIRETGEQGSGLATAGLVLGYVFLGFSLLVCGVWGIAIMAAASSGTT